jgi:hypothetical protein
MENMRIPWPDPDKHPFLLISLLVAIGAIGIAVAIYAAAWGFEFMSNVLPWPAHPFGMYNNVQAK